MSDVVDPSVDDAPDDRAFSVLPTAATVAMPIFPPLPVLPPPPVVPNWSMPAGAAPVVHRSAASAATSVAPTVLPGAFSMYRQPEVPTPPKFDEISAENDVALWLFQVQKACRRGQWPRATWVEFASDFLTAAPLRHYNIAALTAFKAGPTAVAEFNDWDNFCSWCNLNLNVHDHMQRALDSLETLKQTGTVSAYKASFDALVLHAEVPPRMQMHYWRKGLKTHLLELTCLDPLTKCKYVNVADAQNHALAIASVASSSSMVLPTGASNGEIDEGGNFVKRFRPCAPDELDDLRKRKCYKCRQIGHLARDCHLQ